MWFGASAVWLVGCLAGCDWVFNLTHLDVDASSSIDTVPGDAAPGPGVWAQVAVGDGFTCAITVDGALYTWGYNGEGQLGLDRGDAEILTPNRVGAAAWTAFAAATEHACGIQSDGTLWCWGQNDGGQLGTGQPAISLEPVQIFGGGTWLEVATHDRFTCAIRDDHTLWCWGHNVEGELGVGDRTDRLQPTQVDTAATWLHVATGLHHTCALTMDHRLFCWGANGAGEYGDTTTTSMTSPRLVGEDTWAAITAGDSMTCGVKTDGRSYCWGSDLDGDLGDGATVTQTERDTTSPQAVASSATDWTTLVAGAQTVCGLEAPGTMACWGDSAPVALDRPTNKPVEPKPPNPPHVWITLAVGRTHACAITDDHNLYCVGDHSSASAVLVKVAGSYASVAAGDRTTCAIDTTNHLACWGDNARAEIGDGTWNRRLAPTPIAGGTWASTAVADSHTCSVDDQHGVWCWGTEVDSSLGDGMTFASSKPIQLPSLMADHVYAKSEDTWTRLGTSPSRWGYNGTGQLGTVDLTTRATPVLSFVQYTDIAMGLAHTCAVLPSGQVQCAGRNGEYELGNTGTSNSSSFNGISDTSTAYASVYAGTFHTCALDNAGRAHCWGRGSFGELGNGTTMAGMLPTLTAPAPSFTQLALGDHHTCGLTAIGEVYCWGRDHRGQLGDGTTNNTFTPGSKVPNLPPATAITAGYDYTCALTGLGDLFCWGDNRDGQLGTGTGWSSSYFLVPSP
jgi:alpha-tubulin suppressor-like RCC1 family protein